MLFESNRRMRINLGGPRYVENGVGQFQLMKRFPIAIYQCR